MKLKNERETLMKVRDELASGALLHSDFQSVSTNNRFFNMNTPCLLYNCGTIACIGGHAWLIENPEDFDGASKFVHAMEQHTPALYRLFFPDVDDYVSIQPEEAAQAIDNYLNGEEVPWEGVIE